MRAAANGGRRLAAHRLAVSLGAPFWFDVLGRFARLRATGKREDPK